MENANKKIQDNLKSYSDNAQKAADEANKNATSAMDSANTAKSDVLGLKDFTDEAFEDGIISRSEAVAIGKYGERHQERGGINLQHVIYQPFPFRYPKNGFTERQGDVHGSGG